MIEFTAEEIAVATGGTLTAGCDPRTVIRHACTDSREVTADSLFIAKPGERADGHDFISVARAAGATLILAERQTTDERGESDPAVIVDDVVTAMGALAREVITRVRAHSPTTVFGITGSVGKTTSKDLLANLCAAHGKTISPTGSYNGEVGVPLTIFQAELDTRYMVIEMGADRVGNIADLCQIATPDIGVVLALGQAHVESFGSIDAIIQTKGELVEALRPGGIAVLNADDPNVASMATRAGDGVEVRWFTTSETVPEDYGITVQAAELHTTERENPEFILRHVGDTIGYPVTSQLMGEHHTTNLLAAASAAEAAGLNLATIAQQLTDMQAVSPHRMAATEREDGVLVIDDAYNANPKSMRAGLKTLAILGRNTSRRTWAVLGLMAELGPDSIKEHIKIGEAVVRLNINQLLVVGTDARPLYTGAVMEGSWGAEAEHVATIDEAMAVLKDQLRAGDIVFVKGSNSTGMWQLADQLVSFPESFAAEGNHKC